MLFEQHFTRERIKTIENEVYVLHERYNNLFYNKPEHTADILIWELTLAETNREIVARTTELKSLKGA
jgi:hypothetical protein